MAGAVHQMPGNHDVEQRDDRQGNGVEDQEATQNNSSGVLDAPLLRKGITRAKGHVFVYHQNLGETNTHLIGKVIWSSFRLLSYSKNS